jgi:lipopolysaccharide transport system permease protein
VVGLIDFLISFLFLGILMLFYGVFPDWRILFLPIFIFMAIAASLGAGYLVAALMVKYRDFKIIVPFVVQFGLYISPVGFTSDIVPEKWQLLFSLNPMAAIIDGFRWALLRGQSPLYVPGLVLSTGIVCLLFWFGISYFRRVERSFADVI